MPWSLRAPAVATHLVTALCVHNGRLYGTDSAGRLLLWNDVDAWTTQVPLLGIYFTSLISFQGSLYGLAYYGRLYKWNNAAAWVQVAERVFDWYAYQLSSINSKIYAQNGPHLIEWNGTNAWAIKATAPTISVSPRLLCCYSFDGSIFCGQWPEGYLYRWDGVATLTQVAGVWPAHPPGGGNLHIWSLKDLNGVLYGTASPDLRAPYPARLLAWDGSMGWIDIAWDTLNGSRLNAVESLNGFLYFGMTANSTRLMKWDNVSATLTQVHASYPGTTGIDCLARYFSCNFAGTGPTGILLSDGTVSSSPSTSPSLSASPSWSPSGSHSPSSSISKSPSPSTSPSHSISRSASKSKSSSQSSSTSKSVSKSPSSSQSKSLSPSGSISPSPSIGPWPATDYPVITARIIHDPHDHSYFALRIRSSLDPSASSTTTIFYMKPGSQTVYSIPTTIVSTWPFELEAVIDEIPNDTPGKWIFRPFVAVEGRQFNCDAFFLNVQKKLAHTTQEE